MKRLFILTNMKGKKIKFDNGEVAYWETKSLAKVYRDKLNEELGHIEWRITRGPDNLKSAKPNHRAISSLRKYQRGNRGRM